MEDSLLNLYAVFGVAASTGLNSTLPLLLIGLLHSFGLLQLSAPYDVLAHPLVMVVLGILVLAELVGDRIPGLDHIIHGPQAIFTLLAGAIIAGTQSQAISSVNPELLAVIGLVTAGATHLARASLRPIVNIATFGQGGKIVSTIEDVSSVALVGSSLVAPWLVPVMLIVMFVVWVGLLFLMVRLALRVTKNLKGLWGQAWSLVAGGVSPNAWRERARPWDYSWEVKHEMVDTPIFGEKRGVEDAPKSAALTIMEPPARRSSERRHNKSWKDDDIWRI